jgi:hypothetical protein
MRFIIIALLLLSLPAHAIKVTLTCDKPTKRVDGSDIIGPVTIHYYKNGTELANNPDCSYTYEEIDKTLINYTLTAKDQYGIESDHSDPMQINLSPPNKPASIKIHITIE